jgi:phage baseplate assembly protein W
MDSDEVIVFQDFDPNFALGSDGDINTVTNVESIYASLENILLTMTGERVMHRDFPGTIQSMLMEPMLGDVLQKTAERQFPALIQKWDDRIQVSYCNLTTDQDNQTIILDAEFYIQGYDNVFTLQTPLN